MSQYLVLGAGKSGIAAQKLLQRENHSVVMIDGSDKFPCGEFAAVIASPAIPLEHHWIQKAREAGFQILSELELGSRFWKGRSVAITGSKGKSSLVKLIADTLNKAGINARTAGNYGTPLCQCVLEEPNDGKNAVTIVEVSSFQMEHTSTFSPEAACILNLQADHLDRHGSMEIYGDLKRKLFTAMKPDSLAIVPEDFDLRNFLPLGVKLHRLTGKLDINISGSYFDNEILKNAAECAVLICRKLGISNDEIQRGFQTFEPLPHRMQKVIQNNGITYINDSKATSLSAMAAGVEMCKGSVRLIAGGLLKEKDVNFVKDILVKRVKKVYLIGECSEIFFNAWSKIVPCEMCGTMETAVNAACTDAKKDETVLLSPGTASFDQFKGMAARGQQFVKCVQNFIEKEKVNS